MADLTDDQKERLRELHERAEAAATEDGTATEEDYAYWDAAAGALPALLDENDRLRENATATRGETTLLRERAAHAEQERDRLREENRTLGKLAALLRQQRDTLAQDVRAEAYGLEGLPHSSRPDMLAQLADRLHQACARAGGQH